MTLWAQFGFSLRGVLTFVASGLDIIGCVLSYFEGKANLHCYTSCTLTTSFDSFQQRCQCCQVHQLLNKFNSALKQLYRKQQYHYSVQFSSKLVDSVSAVEYIKNITDYYLLSFKAQALRFNLYVFVWLSTEENTRSRCCPGIFHRPSSHITAVACGL